MIKVHYFFDPMCGWCFGATQLVDIIQNHSEFELVLHPGGMIERQPIEVSFRQHIVQADKRIALETGATFGEAYLSRVNSELPLVLDSFLAIRAIYVASRIGLSGFDMLKAIQRAHYQLGQNVEQGETLKRIAIELGADATQWQHEMDLQGAASVDWVNETHQLMVEHQVRGYPTLFADVDGKWLRLPHSQYYSQPQSWEAWLSTLL